MESQFCLVKSTRFPLKSLILLLFKLDFLLVGWSNPNFELVKVPLVLLVLFSLVNFHFFLKSSSEELYPPTYKRKGGKARSLLSWAVGTLMLSWSQRENHRSRQELGTLVDRNIWGFP